jgi:hypothetical protein
MGHEAIQYVLVHKDLDEPRHNGARQEKGNRFDKDTQKDGDEGLKSLDQGGKSRGGQTSCN